MMAEDTSAGDVEDPSALQTAAGNNALSSITGSKKNKVIIGVTILLAAAVVAIALGVTLGKDRNGVGNETSSAKETTTNGDTKNDGPTYSPTTPSPSTYPPTVDDHAPPQEESSAVVYKAKYLAQNGPIQAQVRIIDPSVADGYESCDDMKEDILNALKHHANRIIISESEYDWYEDCDPNNPYGYYGTYNPTSPAPTGHPTLSSSPSKSATPTYSPSLSSSPTTSPAPSPISEEPTYGGTVTVGMDKMPDGPVTEDSFGTNNQVLGVDEADIAKSDGVYVYAGYGDLLYVWNATDGTQGVSITKIPKNYNTTSKPRIQALLLEGYRLTAIVSEETGFDYWHYEETGEERPIISEYTELTLRVYDISDVPTDGGPLALLGEKVIKGGYDSARSVGSTGYVITTTYVDKSSFADGLYRYQPQYCGLNSTEYKEMAAEAALNNTQPFMERLVDEMQLHLDGTCRNTFRISAMQSGDIIEDHSNDGDMLSQLVQISSFDMAAEFVNGEILTESARAFSSGWLESVYASQNFAAALNVGYSYNPESGEWGSSTFILGFNISSGTRPEPFCFAEIGGSPLNQYSTDLYDGHLRVVTTEWNWSVEDGSSTTNKIFVLRVPAEKNEGQVMTLTAETDHLGKPNESVYAVRFIKDKAYIVTFENTDPFYIFDLSDPSNPQKMGELEIPGFSSYLHPVEIDGVPLMLGVGEHVNESSGQWVGVKISLLDISDPRTPTENATFVDEGAWSSAGNDFKAFRYLPLSKKLILPKSEYTWSEEGNFDGFVVYDVSLDEISPAYEIQHASSYDMYHGCWYDAYMPPRSFVFQSKLSTILSHSVISTNLKNGNELWNLTLGENITEVYCSSYFFDDW